MWQKVLRDRHHPGRLARRHFEVCVFTYLAAELRSGDIAVARSNSYANLHAQLMPWAVCEPLVAGYCAQAGIPDTAAGFVAWMRAELTRTATAVDAGYPANADLVIDPDSGAPMLKARRGRERRASARVLEEEIHARLPQRSLLDILTRTAHLLGWHRHFGPASGSDPKLADPLARYALMTFTYGSNLGPAQVARHLRGQVSAHELSTAANKHVTAGKLDLASGDVTNGYVALDLARAYGDGRTAGTDGSQIDTWEDTLLAETSVRYGGYGGIAFRHISDTYIALFSRFIPCGVWEAVYIIDGLLANPSEVTSDVVHADTQGQSLPVFGLATLLGIDLLPRIRNWKDLIFYRPDPQARYQHIDALFAEHTIDWRLIEVHWPDLMRTAISIREGALSSVTLLRRLGHDSRKNRLYRAFRELGRAVRTLVLLRYLSEPALRDSIAAMTNKVEAFHGFAAWLMFGGDLLGHNDPDHHEKIIKFNELVANCVIYHNALDITAADGHPVDPDDLATISPYLRENIRRFGEWILDTSPPEQTPTRLDVTLPKMDFRR
ncbi:transposase [Candidatus Frankia alpina]|uniref:transposase n=1 Tax=Candidatus Frankia alpina TaxID=2699483 RepID=UPI002E272801